MMIEHSKHRVMRVVLALSIASILTVACGDPAKKSTSPADSPGQATTAGMNTCAGCHTEVTAAWLTSKHANLDPVGSLDSAGLPAMGQLAGCEACHDPHGDSGRLIAGTTGAAGVQRPVVGCEACHGPGSLHADAGGAGPISRLGSAAEGVIGPVQVSAQYTTCTACHGLLDSAGTGTAATTHDAASTIAPTGAGYTITDTHFATPGNYPGGSNRYANKVDITGYTMDFGSERVCTDCHDPHTSADINREWAASRHAEKAAGAPWAHYNWSCDGSDGSATGGCGTTGSANTDRRLCQRCHTTSGYTAFANALRAGDLTTADLISSGAASPPPVAYSAGFKPEMLKCTGCHTDNRGTLRNPGAYTAKYNYVSGADVLSAASHAYPDVSGSNVCVLCHSARQSGDTVKNLVLSGPTVTTFGILGFIDSHYLSAAGTMFMGTGYEFGRSYANPASYKHDKIGSPAAPNTGSNGPCVGCHMYRADASANHLFTAIGKDANGVVTSIVSEVCYNCHAGSSSALADIVEKEREEFEQALSALINGLDKKGISFTSAYPYMFKQRTAAGLVTVTTDSTFVTGDLTAFVSAGTRTTDKFRAEVDETVYAIASVNSDTRITLKSAFTGTTLSGGAYVIMRGTAGDAVKDWLGGGSEEDGRNNLGAAFNLQLLEHEPGAFVHNRAYTRRLLYDSLDWLDNNAMDYSVGGTLNALPDGTTYKAGAMLYLLPNGVIDGVAAERP